MSQVKQMKFVVVFCLAMLLMSGPGLAQTPDEAARASFRQAYQVFDQEGIEASTPVFYAVAEDFPGTPWGAKALFHLGLFTEPEESLAAYQRIVTEYAGTDFEYLARMYVILHEFGYDAQGRMDRKDLLAQSLGGPPLADIMTSGATEHFAALRAMPRRTQFDLSMIYGSVWNDLAEGQRRPKYALPLAIFNRAFVLLGVSDSHHVTTMIYMGLGLELNKRDQRTDPVVSIETPAPGAVTGPSPEIIVSITGGDFQHHQVDLGKLEFLLDGHDITPITAVASTINETPELGEPLEMLTLTATFQAPLAPGTHTLTLVVPTESYPGEGPGRTTLTQTFIVGTPPDPTTQTLPSTKDTTIYDRGPHKNEGANPRLFLKKVQGKPAHFLVGFDTANLITNGLTKATLVLTIDSSQNVTGWGNGRPIRARRLLTDWAEGNGKGLELPNNQQTSGSGSGATWFSPVDANIANNQADSAVTWSGAQSFTAPSTAPTVTIKNHQSGEVSFDVTEDLLLGAPHGWLISRDQDVGSQVAFHSREAGAALAPRLVLEYGSSLTKHHHLANPLALLVSMRTQPMATTQALWSEGQSSLISLLDGEPLSASSTTAIVTLKPLEASPETRPGFRQALRQNPVLAAVGGQLVGSLAGPNPITQGLAGTAYRGWLELG